MADEVNYGTARATDPGDTEELSKAELQRRMEEARESISQTVAEIKDTVVNQYQSVKESVAETLDWREQYRKRPLAWSLGALGAGLLVGYTVGGLFGGGGDDEYEYDEQRRALSPEDTRIFNMPPSSLEHSSYAAPRSYAAQAITGGAYGSSAYAGSGVETEYDEQRAAPPAPAARGGYDSGGSQAEQQQEEETEQGPGLLERFRETKAYDRLQQEVSTLGDRFIEELSKTAQTVVLPALFSKLKDLFGVDLSGNKSPQGGSGSTGGGGSASNAGAGYGGGMSTSGGGAGASTSGGTSYATSENQPFGHDVGNG